jgi:hypothetical protein
MTTVTEIAADVFRISLYVRRSPLDQPKILPTSMALSMQETARLRCMTLGRC